MTSRRDLLKRIAAPLVRLYGEREARQIALMTVSELTGIAPSTLLADPAAPVETLGLERAAAELAAGRPMQYVLGAVEFCGLRIGVREGVLIPRPETEELVHWIAAENPQARRLLDIGTGSGCIALALKHLLPQAEVYGGDLSEEALAIARENASALGLEAEFRQVDALRDTREERTDTDRISIATTSLKKPSPNYPPHGITCDAERPTSAALRNGNEEPSVLTASGSRKAPVPEPTPEDSLRQETTAKGTKVPTLAEGFPLAFDVIVSNPPYIPLGERTQMRSNVTEHEPGLALFVPDGDPLLFYRAIARTALGMLAPGGRLYFEVHERFAAETRGLMLAAGYTEVLLRADFNDKPRMLCGRKTK